MATSVTLTETGSLNKVLHSLLWLLKLRVRVRACVFSGDLRLEETIKQTTCRPEKATLWPRCPLSVSCMTGSSQQGPQDYINESEVASRLRLPPGLI